MEDGLLGKFFSYLLIKGLISQI